MIRPWNIQVDETNNNVRIVRKWLDKTFFSYILPLTIGWNGFVACFIWILFLSGNITFSSGDITPHIPIMFDIIIMLFILMGVYFIYLVIVNLINKTEIIADNEEITISHKPLYYPGLKSKRLRVSNLNSFYHDSIPSPYYTYEISANTHTGIDKNLLTVSTSQEADFIEKTLEKYYQLEPELKTESEPKNISASNLQSKEESPIATSGKDSNEIETPRSIKIHQDNNQIKISQKWSEGTFMATFAILWNGIIIVLALLFANSDNTSGNPSLVFPYFLVFFSVGLIWIYVAVVLWRNYTYIVANEELITVSYGPVPYPWFSNQQIEATQLKRLYSKIYSKIYSKGSKNNSYMYIIHAKMSRGEINLVKVDRREEALLIERTLENYYNISD